MCDPVHTPALLDYEASEANPSDGVFGHASDQLGRWTKQEDGTADPTHPLHTWLATLSHGRGTSLAVCLWARTLSMATLSLTEAAAYLSKLVESALTTHERFEITRNGTRVAVLIGADDYDSLVETLDVLSHPDEMAAIQVGLADLDAGEVYSADEIRAAHLCDPRNS